MPSLLIVLLALPLLLLAESKLEVELRSENAKLSAENKKLRADLDALKERVEHNSSGISKTASDLVAARKDIVRLTVEKNTLDAANAALVADAKENKLLIKQLTVMMHDQTVIIVASMKTLQQKGIVIIGGVGALIAILLIGIAINVYLQKRRLNWLEEWRRNRFMNDPNHGAGDTPADLPSDTV